LIRNLEVLVLGGRPNREPIARYRPFVTNTREEIITAIDDSKPKLGQSRSNVL